MGTYVDWLWTIPVVPLIWIVLVKPIGAKIGRLARPAAKPLSVAPAGLLRQLDVTPDERVLDLGGMALSQVLIQLNAAIDRVEAGESGPASLSDIVVASRSALVAFKDSVTWAERTAGAAPDAVTSQTMVEAMLDSMKMCPLGSGEWKDMKRTFDQLCDFMASRTP